MAALCWKDSHRAAVGRFAVLINPKVHKRHAIDSFIAAVLDRDPVPVTGVAITGSDGWSLPNMTPSRFKELVAEVPK